MSGITGFYHRTSGAFRETTKIEEALHGMQETITHKGHDISYGEYVNDDVAMAQTALMNPFLSQKPFPLITGFWQGKTASMVFSGEIYNRRDLLLTLSLSGAFAKNEEPSDAQLVLYGILIHGLSFCEHINGVFSFAVYFHGTRTLSLVRDRLGVKPLFYVADFHQCFLFGSEPKAILSFPGFRARLSREGLGEIFALGPAHTPGKSIYKDILEVLPGHILTVFPDGTYRQKPYWSLTAREHTDSYEDSVASIQALVMDAVTMQSEGELPVGAFLSGGLDSSIVTSLSCLNLEKKGERLSTFSFDFEDSASYFVANAFQPDLDRPYVDIMKEYCHSDHEYLICNNENLICSLFRAVDASDGPCMADVSSSLLFFCEQTAKKRQIILTGECADEVFGGYPWFHRKELWEIDGFPWASQFDTRSLLLTDRVTGLISLSEYSKDAYETACSKIPFLSSDPEAKLHRKICYLSLTWFMQTLLDRMDRAASYTGLIARVPFADHRLVSYLYNIPRTMKFQNGVKGMLKDAAKPWLPDEIRKRKKSPYPKTYHPEYTKRLGQMLCQMLSEKEHPLHLFVDLDKVKEYLKKPSNLTLPWYGQLMAGPQLLAYYLQLGYWLSSYQVQFTF